MRKSTILLILILSVLQLAAQDRKHIANFSQFQQYYNPALTGYQGSLLKGFYRDQWSGFADAPRTLFLSGEVNLADIKNNSLFATEALELSPRQGVQHAFGLSFFQDTFGPAKESQAVLNYGSTLQLSEKLSLRGGAGITYSNSKFSASNQVLNEEDDQHYQAMLGNGHNRVGLNLGVALAAADYFVGYGVQHVVKHTSSDSEYLKEIYGMQHVAQVGIRKGLSDHFGLVANGLYRYDKHYKNTLEGQLKAVYNNSVWAGGGYRHDLAYTFSAGVRLQQFQVGYSREVATGNAESVYKGGNEVMVTYNLAPVLTNVGSALSIW